MKYKVIAVDIDGTLLNNKSELTKNTLNTIIEAINKGLIFVISTGRPYISAKRYSDLIPYDIPMVCYNGSVVRKSRSNEIFFETKINKEDSLKVIEYIESKKGQYIIWTNSELYVSSESDYMKEYMKISPIPAKLIKDKKDIPYDEIIKFIWLEEPQKLIDYQKELRSNEIYGWNNLNFFTSQPYFLEIVNKESDKAKGLEKLLEYLEISKDELIAVGDGYNDLSMIEYAGLGVAMGNSSEELKSKADYVCESNEEDGVACVIKKYYLEN